MPTFCWSRNSFLASGLAVTLLMALVEPIWALSCRNRPTSPRLPTITLAKADVDVTVATKLDHYAKCIGLSFQVKDDILDEESDTATLGKTQGKDKDNDKPTYPALLGLAGAKQKAQELHEKALESLSIFGQEADLLRDLSLYIIQRTH